MRVIHSDYYIAREDLLILIIKTSCELDCLHHRCEALPVPFSSIKEQYRGRALEHLVSSGTEGFVNGPIVCK